MGRDECPTVVALQGWKRARRWSLRLFQVAGQCVVPRTAGRAKNGEHDAIEKGATTVEEIHKSIAALPLHILEESELLKGPSHERRPGLAWHLAARRSSV